MLVYFPKTRLFVKLLCTFENSVKFLPFVRVFQTFKKMYIMKKIYSSLLLALLLLHSVEIEAGKTKGKIVDPGPRSPLISVSVNGNGGTSLSSGVSNTVSLNPNVGIEVVWMNLGFGIDASTFDTKSNFDLDAYSAPLRNLDYLSITNASNSWRSTSILFGPSYTIPFGNLKPISGIGIVVKHNPPATLTLSVKGGITFNQTPDFSIVETSSQRNIAINNADAYSKNVLTFKPNVAFSFWLTEDIAISANVQYTMQRGQGAFITKYRDLSNVDFTSPKADLIRQQISSAPVFTNTTNGPDKYLSAGIGITYRFGKKGWDGSIKGNRKGITENGLKKNEAQRKGINEGGLKKNETQRKGINENGLKKNETERKGINENGLKKNELENSMADVEVKAIAESLVTMRKGWDGSIKGNKVDAKANADVKSIAETLVILARKGWDGSIKGNKAAYEPNEADVKSVTETLVNIRKGWDGSIKGNKVEYVANEAEVKAIAETMVNLRKGWDGSVKGNRKGWDGSVKGGKISNALKTKHDTAKNSVGNIR